jgi:hypothetical protein
MARAPAITAIKDAIRAYWDALGIIKAPNVEPTKIERVEVGPIESWREVPNTRYTKQATIAEYKPTSGGKFAKETKAIASGIVKAPTVIPAITSGLNHSLLYDLAHLVMGRNELIFTILYLNLRELMDVFFDYSSKFSK